MSSESRSPWFSPWDLLPLLAALALAAGLPTLLHGLPDPLPTHFDSLGRPNGWTPQSAFPWICFGLPGFIWLMLLLTGRILVGTSQDPDGRKAAAMLPLRGLMTTGALLLMGSIPLISRFGMSVTWGAVALFIGLLIFGLVLTVRKLKAEVPHDGGAELYRWGLLYVNPEDSRIWVPKRLGVGWTLNFGHSMSWFILILLLLIPVVIGLSLAH
jgi:uncharacterized membrane protein